jgi:hypothetical protein
MTGFDKEFERLRRNSQAFAPVPMIDKKIASHRFSWDESA